tara:strand:- start:206 stop:1387 length:1182 start_codon:yes stop_codon:yes gene_type:complete
MTFTATLRPHQFDAVGAMIDNNKGQIICPTGSGKTLIAIFDAYREFKSSTPKTCVVVSPRLLLSNQLCSEFLEHIDNAHVLHVHSGETQYFKTTNPNRIKLFVDNVEGHKLIFTTYHSLHRVVEAGVKVDTIHFDEAHNSVQRHFFPAVEHYAQEANRSYFYTATPKHSLSVFKPGMNDAEVYGNVIVNVPAPQLVEEGYILPPKVAVKQLPMVQDKQMVAERDAENLVETIDEHSLNKILICARSTRQIVKLVTESDFSTELQERGYSVMYITAKTGGVIDGKKVGRDEFFKTLNEWGKDSTKKFVVLHHSILSEGISVSGLEAVLFMRNMDYIGLSQSIGRVIRLGGPEKTFGLVVVPVYDRVGINTAKSVQAVVDTVFNEGQPAVSVVRK